LSNPCFTAPKVTVTLARIATSRGNPVSALRPLGTSTDKIGHSARLTSSINFIQAPLSGRFKPIPNNPSTISAGRRDSCMAKAGPV
jgi:hypothetical protein